MRPDGGGGWASTARLPLFSVVFMLVLAMTACATGRTASPEPSADRIEESVASYTTEQANRGQRVFSTVCAVCHGANDFRGPIFEATWMADPVVNLFDHVSTAMPQDDPGSLSAEQYAAVVAYIMRLNGLPPGERALPATAQELAGMRW